MNSVSVRSDSSSYQQVSWILEQLKDSHLAIRDQILSHKQVRSEELKLVRDSLVATEEQMIAALEEYVREGNPEVLNAWIQYVPLEEIVQSILDIHLEDDISVDELIERKTRYDESVLQLLEHLSRETSIPPVEEAFQQMAAQARQAMAQQSWRFRDSDLT